MPSQPLTVSVIVPVFNEVRTVQELLHRVRAVPIDLEVIVVDDGSTDGTRDLLARLPLDVKVILHDRNRGKGAALRTGFAAASGDVLIVQDADLEYDPSEYPKLLQPIRDGRADVVYGVRFRGANRSSMLSRLFNSAITWISNRFTGLELSDIETCYKVFPRRFLEPLNLQEDRFGFDPEFTSKIAALPCLVDEVAVSYVRRSYRDGKKIGLRDAVRALWCVIRYPPPRRKRLARRVTGT
ncbi:MAG TPA: glycosyltransferase family 2 protein [Vicinamibacterales bacterium]|nr:glycosyltransferase family 2 protein [Vicinamibacterales bacterium]